MDNSALQAARSQQRTTIRIVSLVGFLVFLIIAGLGAWMTWSAYDRGQNWTPVTATVQQLDILCDVEKKNGKNWSFVETLPCEEAKTFVAERDGVLTPWRWTEVEFALLSYEAVGQGQQARVRSAAIADGPLKVGMSIPILVNPSNPIDIARPFTSADVDSFWMMLLVGAGIWVLTTGIGIFVAGANRRSQEKRAVVTSLTDSHWGGNPAAAASSGQHRGAEQPAAVVPSLPGWARVLRVIGLIVLILSIGFATLAAIGSEGDGEVLTGAAVILGAGILVWGLLRLVTRRPTAKPPVEPAKPTWGRS